MRKIIKKWGDSFILTLTPEDMKVYEMQEGDVIEIAVAKVINSEHNSNQDTSGHCPSYASGNIHSL